MTQFGQTLPATPQIYSNGSLQQLTKTGMAHHLAKVLKTVGMVPMQSLWSYDVLNEDPYYVELPLAGDINNRCTYCFPFEFPDTSTFSINNELYRPYIMLVYYIGNTNTVNNTGRNEDILRVDAGIMKDGIVSLGGGTPGDFLISGLDSRGRYREYNGNFWGWGGCEDFTNTGGGGAMGDLARGSFIQRGDWLPYASSTAVNHQRLTIQNTFCYLGPAGFFLYVGTGQDRTQFGNLMAIAMPFHGARLPDRAQTPDVNLNRINPLGYIPLNESESEVYNVGLRQADMLIHGMQHDLTFSLNWVTANLWNLENTEIAFNPDRRLNTVPSPREIAGGGGAHILGRMVVRPDHLFADVLELYGPVIPQIVSNDPRPTFSEVFAAPQFRFGDIIAPLGNFEDPDTLINWYIVPWPQFAMTIALYAENVNLGSVYATGTKTVVLTRTYSMSSVDETGTGAFLTEVNVVGSPVGATLDLLRGAVEFGTNTARWNSNAAEDRIYAQMSPCSNNTGHTLNLTFNVPITDTLDTVHEVRYEARCRGGAEDKNGFFASFLVNGLFLGFAVANPGGTKFSRIFSAGANTLHTSWNYVEYNSVILLRDNTATDGAIRVTWRFQRDDANDACLCEIQNLRLLSYRYI